MDRLREIALLFGLKPTKPEAPGKRFLFEGHDVDLRGPLPTIEGVKLSDREAVLLAICRQLSTRLSAAYTEGVEALFKD